jgi:hypothetical protein
MASIASSMAKAPPPYGDISYGNSMRAMAFYGEHQTASKFPRSIYSSL